MCVAVRTSELSNEKNGNRAYVSDDICPVAVFLERLKQCTVSQENKLMLKVCEHM